MPDWGRRINTMAELQHMILTPGTEPEVRTTDLNYDKIVEVVGYPVEVINLNGGAAIMYVCEEGKQKGMPYNEPATKIANASLRGGDYISGTALIVGPMKAGGVDSSLPDNVAADLMGVLA